MASFGLGSDREYFVENLTLLISSGMDILMSLDSIQGEVGSRKMKRILGEIKESMESGSPLWQALEETGIFSSRIISLIRIGEQSGRLVENLKVVSIQQQKEREFRSKIRSAAMYPVLILIVTAVVGIGIAWFILPRLAQVFSQLKIELPLITRLLIRTGNFLSQYGTIAMPLVIVFLTAFVFFVFFFRKTKFIGQFAAFHFPIIKTIMQQVELARMGYVFGTLLEAGLPITESLESLTETTDIRAYKKFYLYLLKNIEEGNSLQKSFKNYKKSNKLVPLPIQQIIAAGEQSGRLPESLKKIGETFESKIDASTKALAVMLEPILLVIVWLGVLAVAVAVILPIYSLVGGFQTQ